MLRDYLRTAYRAAIPFIYARTNYKMFLQRSFTELDDATRSLICATDVLSNVVRPVPITAPFGKSMLVVAPHQDDEIIGCGGAVLLQKKMGKDINIVFVQDGGNEYKEDGMSSREELVHVREEEANAVARELGIPPPRFLRHVKLKEEVSIIAKELREEVLRTNADVIFVPFLLDPNIDHFFTNYAFAEALAGITKGRRVFGYEVWSLCVANVILIIDRVIEEKKKLLSFYRSQLAGTDYLHCITGLNMYHSRCFGAGVCRYAEKFFEIPAEDYVTVVNKILQKRQNNNGLLGS